MSARTRRSRAARGARSTTERDCSGPPAHPRSRRSSPASSAPPRAPSPPDTSGPHSRGVHWLWFTDGEFAHLATGAADFEPTNPSDDQLYLIVDVRDPRHPREVGRWWLPGTRAGDRCLPGCLPARQPAWTHTVQPLFRRRLAVVSDEAVEERCRDAPKLVWLVDLRDEAHPVIVGTAPLPHDVAALCARGGRFGAHNLHPSFPGPASAHLENTFVGTFFNGGVRIYRLVDAPMRGAPPRVEEIAYYVPAAPPGNRDGTIQINHAIVDDRGLVFANDRLTGGLYVLRYTGKRPLD